MTITEHADAILCAASTDLTYYGKNGRKAILAACQALRDEGYLAGAVAMQDRAQKVLWDARRHLAARDIAKIAAIDIAKLENGNEPW